MAGTAPHEPKLHDYVWRDAVVIGVNNYPLLGPCDYWLTCDTHRIAERMPDALSALPPHAETFMNEDHPLPEGIRRPSHWFSRPRGRVDRDMQPAGNYTIPLTWERKLQHVWTSATAAANLAAIMGARAIILYKVDLTGDTLSGNRTVPWAQFSKPVTAFFKRLPCDVYKTNIVSPLNLPIWTPS